MDAASVVTPTSFVAAPNEEQQLDLFDNSSESPFNELTGSDLPAARKQEASEVPGVPTAAATTTSSTLLASEERLAVREEEPRQQMQAIAEKRATNQQPHLEPLLVLQPAAAVELQGVVVPNLKGGNKTAARRAMGSISQEGGLEPRAGSSAGSSVKGVAAANAPSTASLSTQVRVTLLPQKSLRTWNVMGVLCGAGVAAHRVRDESVLRSAARARQVAFVALSPAALFRPQPRYPHSRHVAISSESRPAPPLPNFYSLYLLFRSLPDGRQ